jgi:hypothetical protein
VVQALRDGVNVCQPTVTLDSLNDMKSVRHVLGGGLAGLAVIVPWRSADVHVLGFRRGACCCSRYAANCPTGDDTDRAANQPDSRTCRCSGGGATLGPLRFPRAAGGKQP